MKAASCFQAMVVEVNYFAQLSHNNRQTNVLLRFSNQTTVVLLMVTPLVQNYELWLQCGYTMTSLYVKVDGYTLLVSVMHNYSELLMVHSLQVNAIT